MITKEEVIEKLKEVIDPELGFNIVDLGLIYGVETNGDDVSIKMTLTWPGCPLAQQLVGKAREAVESIPGIGKVNVELVFDPPWSPDMMSEEIKKKIMG